jgi:tRNA A37 threonylcarbamoyladenosine synthetase subunit TsaC/SUA5/YrdC
LAVTSANASGGAPAQSIEEAKKTFGEWVDAYLDGGVAEGEASTVVSVVSEPIVLRDGAVARAEILAVLES